MTEKLFWQDSYQREFTANIVDQFPVADRQAVVLDRTCFYATSGGQPNDLGTLNASPVKDVYYQDERLLHLIDLPLRTPVHGMIDWDRRFDHMQQHSGQHILSAAFFKLYRAETSSFHLGEDYCSIELNMPGLKENEIRDAEELANQVITSATPVSAFFVDRDRAHQYPLRKQSDLAEALRLIQIGDFDLSPCSGTHVRNTGEVGAIFVYGFEKLSQTLKVNFLCGHRVRNRFHSDLAVLKALSKAMTTSFDLLPESVSRLQTQLKDLRKENARLKEGQLKEEVAELSEKATVWKGNRLIVAVWRRPYQEVRFLAQKLSEQAGTIGALVSSEENRAVFFKNPKVDVDLKSIFQQFLNRTSAKGGGPPHFLEAGNFSAGTDPESIIQSLFAR